MRNKRIGLRFCHDVEILREGDDGKMARIEELQVQEESQKRSPFGNSFPAHSSH